MNSIFLALSLALQAPGAVPANDLPASPDPLSKARALLVGVGDYENLSKDLKGPPNDVKIMRSALVEELGFPDSGIATLTTDATDPKEQPTRKRILEAFEELARADIEDQWVVIFLAGHGLGVPDQENGDEPDRMDECFLASDVAAWDPETKELPGAIRDDEIAGAIGTLLARGAFVWLITDSCCSESIHRGATPERVRSLSLRDLEVPAAEPLSMDEPWSGGIGDDWMERGLAEGRLVAFSSTTRRGKAKEMALQDPYDEDRNPYFGIFTHKLVSELRSGKCIATFGDLIRNVELRIEADDKTVQSPTAAGALSRPIPGLDPRPRDLIVTRSEANVTLHAGSLDGVVAGTILEVPGLDGTPVQFELETVLLLESVLELTDPSRGKVRKLIDANVEMIATVLSTPVDPERAIRVHVPEGNAMARAELTKLAQEPWVSLIEDPAEAEWILEESDGAARGPLEPSPMLLTSATDALTSFWMDKVNVEINLKKVYAARGLKRVASNPWSGWLPPGLEVSLFATPPDGEEYEVGPGHQPAPGSSARLEVRNSTKDHWYLDAFALDPVLELDPLSSHKAELPPNRTVNVRPGTTDLFFADDACGAGNVVMIATRKATADTARESFRWLEQHPLEPFRGYPRQASRASYRGSKTRGGRSGTRSALGTLLEDLTQPSRSGFPTDYRDVESFVTLIPYQLEWPAPHVARSMEGAQAVDMEDFRSTLRLEDLPVEVAVGEKADFLKHDIGTICLSGDRVARTWFFDFQKEKPTRVEDAQPCFAFSDTEKGWVSLYRAKSLEAWDLVLLDADRDLVAETVWRRDQVTDGWIETTDARTPLVQLKGRVENLGDYPKEEIKLLRSTLFTDPAPTSAFTSRFSGGAAANRGSTPARASAERTPNGQGDDFQPEDLNGIVRECLGDRELPDWFQGALNVHYVNEPIVNAAAGRGKIGEPVLVVWDGLVETLDRDPRLIRAVIAHEVAHLLLGHAHESKAPPVELRGASDVEHHFTRQLEFEADILACELLEAAGYFRQDLIDSLFKLHDFERENEISWFTSLIGDHSSPIHRIARIEPTNDRFEAFRLVQLGIGLLECRRPGQALKAFDEAVDLEPRLDEARYNAARAALQVYYGALGHDVQDEWLRPEFGPVLTLGDAIQSRGDGISDGDQKRWEAAKERIDDLPRWAYPRMHAFLRGTLEVLHPTGDKAIVLRGVARLARVSLEEGRRGEPSSEFQLQCASNMALGLHRAGEVREAWSLLSSEIEATFPHATASSLTNVARLARREYASGCSRVLVDGIQSILRAEPRGTDRARRLRDSLIALSDQELIDTLDASDPTALELCRPAALDLVRTVVGLTDDLGPSLEGFGAAVIDQAVHSDYRGLRVRAWGEDQNDLQVVCLVEDDSILKLTSYVPGSAIVLRASDEADSREVRIEVGMPIQVAMERLGWTDALNYPVFQGEHLGRTQLASEPTPNEVWNYFGQLDMAILREGDLIVGIAVTPGRQLR